MLHVIRAIPGWIMCTADRCLNPIAIFRVDPRYVLSKCRVLIGIPQANRPYFRRPIDSITNLIMIEDAEMGDSHALPQQLLGLAKRFFGTLEFGHVGCDGEQQSPSSNYSERSAQKMPDTPGAVLCTNNPFAVVEGAVLCEETIDIVFAPLPSVCGFGPIVHRLNVGKRVTGVVCPPLAYLKDSVFAMNGYRQGKCRDNVVQSSRQDRTLPFPRAGGLHSMRPFRIDLSSILQQASGTGR